MKSLSLSQPHAIIMVGIPGSGKTYFAEKFSETFNTPYVSLHEIARVLGSNEKAVISSLADGQIDQLLKTRYSIVIEGGTDSRVERTELTKRLTRAGYQPLMVWVQTDTPTAKARAAKAGTTQTNRILSRDEHDSLVRHFTPPHVKDKSVVVSGKHTYASQVKIVLKRLSAPRAEISTHSKPPTRQFSDIRRNR